MCVCSPSMLSQPSALPIQTTLVCLVLSNHNNNKPFVCICGPDCFQVLDPFFLCQVGGPETTYDLVSQCRFFRLIRGELQLCFYIFFKSAKFWTLTFFVVLCVNMIGFPCLWLSADLSPSTDACVFVGRSRFLRPKQTLNGNNFKKEG